MRKAVFVLLLGLVPAAASAARPPDGAGFQAALAADLDTGRIGPTERLAETFRYVFAPERVSERYRPETATPLRCFTPILAEYRQVRDSLAPALRAELDGYLERPRGLGRATYFSPSGIFRLNYQTTGGNAVPTTDVNPANGIPDFVERCAEYMDESWDVEITNLGFTAPFLVGGAYDVSFQQMGVYGFTSPTGSTTEIVLHRNFIGFPPNTDPDGNQLGAAKVTCAHEFKHASQYTNNNWNEGGWVELDATWVEDIVYPDTNDYWNYVAGNGAHVLGQPWTPLDAGGSGSYEDCLWQHHLSGVHGNGIIVEVGAQLDANPGYTMKKAYQEAMFVYGTEWDDAYPGFLEWAWFTGSRSEPPFGFPDAPSLKRMNLRTSSVSAYPWSRSDSVDQLAGHPYRFNPGSATGYPRIDFDGDDALANFTVSVLVMDTDDSFTIVRPALDAARDVSYVVPLPWSSIQYVGVIVTNSRRSGGVVPYSLDVTDDPGGATDAARLGGRLEAGLRQAPAVPNPAGRSTRLAWTLPASGHVTVRIHDVAGRVVRTLVDGEAEAGEASAVWNTRDSAGRRVPAGVYWVRVESAGESVTRKVTVLH